MTDENVKQIHVCVLYKIGDVLWIVDSAAQKANKCPGVFNHNLILRVLKNRHQVQVQIVCQDHAIKFLDEQILLDKIIPFNLRRTCHKTLLTLNINLAKSIETLDNYRQIVISIWVEHCLASLQTMFIVEAILKLKLSQTCAYQALRCQIAFNNWMIIDE